MGCSVSPGKQCGLPQQLLPAYSLYSRYDSKVTPANNASIHLVNVEYITIQRTEKKTHQRKERYLKGTAEVLRGSTSPLHGHPWSLVALQQILLTFPRSFPVISFFTLEGTHCSSHYFVLWWLLIWRRNTCYLICRQLEAGSSGLIKRHKTDYANVIAYFYLYLNIQFH